MKIYNLTFVLKTLFSQNNLRYITYSLFITLFITLLESCSNRDTTRVCYLNLQPDAPVEVATAVQKELCIDDYFVLLDDNDKIVSSKKRGLTPLDNDSKNIYFKLYDSQNENLSSIADNYRIDISFRYDSLGSLDKLFLKTQRYEHSFWHAYNDAGSFDLMLDSKQSRLKPKLQQRIVLEKIINYIKKVAFK